MVSVENKIDSSIEYFTTSTPPPLMLKRKTHYPGFTVMEYEFFEKWLTDFVGDIHEQVPEKKNSRSYGLLGISNRV